MQTENGLKKFRHCVLEKVYLDTSDSKVLLSNLYGLIHLLNRNIVFGKEYFHVPHIIPNHVDDSNNHSNLFPFILHIYNCSETESSSGAGSKTNQQTLIEISEGNLYLGLDISNHLVVGGHIRIGFSIPWNF